MTSGDGFTEVVRRKSKSGRKSIQQPRIPPTVEFCPEWRTIVQKVLLCRHELKRTQFYADTSSLVESKFPLHQVSTIVCYGIGHIGTCHIALHQFSLLVEMMTSYQHHHQILVYDPLLREDEKEAIRNCGCHIIQQNQHCKYLVEDWTLFYMPHCGKAMYNNLLWTNWSVDCLRQCAIIGNSFNSYHYKLSSKQLLEEASCIHKINTLCREYPLPTNYPDNTIFNDTSLHIFPLEQLSTITQEQWEDCPEPIPNTSDPEIILDNI